MATDPFDFREMMKLFDPNAVSKMFDPDLLRSNFAKMNLPSVDFEALVDSNKKNLEAIQEANKSAIESYRNMYEMQMAIFNDLTKAAQLSADSIKGMPASGDMARQQEIYRVAMEKAFSLMADLANASRKANAEVFAMVEKQTKAAMEEIRNG